MSLRISKEFKFEAAHRLTFHKGGCRNVHGHSYKAKVHITGPKNKDGLVIDFGDLKFVQEWLDAHWDHAYIYYEGQDAVGTYLSAEGFKTFAFPREPTAEQMAEYLAEIVTQQLHLRDPSTLQTLHVEVTVWETVTSSATAFRATVA